VARPILWENIENEDNARDRLVVWRGRVWHRAGQSPAGYADAYLVFIVAHDGSYGATVNDATGVTFPIAARGPFYCIEDARAWGIEVAERHHRPTRRRTPSQPLVSVWDLIRHPVI
jgi:hypothetical protein